MPPAEGFLRGCPFRTDQMGEFLFFGHINQLGATVAQAALAPQFLRFYGLKLTGQLGFSVVWAGAGSGGNNATI